MAFLVLASASPARLSTLRAAGIEPVVHVSGVDEDAVLAAATRSDGPPAPAQAVLLLASAKAQQVAETVDAAAGGLVLGCDSLLELDGEIFGKPRDAAQAVERWELMRGRSGVLHTGHWLVDRRPGPRSDTPTQVGATSSTVVHFADLSDAEVSAYVATGEPLAVAGAFTVDGLGGAFVTGIEGDYHGVVGVSLPLLRDLLAEVRLTVPELWAAQQAAADREADRVLLRTPRLVIRPFRTADAPTLATYRSDPEVARFQGWDAPVSLEQALDLVASSGGPVLRTPDRWSQLVVEADGRHVGDVAVRRDADPRQARVGVTLAREAQGSGYATEALTGLLDHLFTQHGVHRVVADCDARNTASAALLERVGMRREAHHRSASWSKGEWTDEYVYAVLADEWPGTGW